jgi:hypothetical protein
MGAMKGLWRHLASVAAAAAFVGTLAAAPAAVHAAPGSVTFGPVTAKSTFLQGIDVSEPVTLPEGVLLVEVLLTTNATGSADVAVLSPTPAAGQTTLTYHVPTPSGAMVPNTLVHLRFRVTLQVGPGSTVQETGPLATVRYADTRFDWKTRSGKVVRVHWVAGDDTFGRRALAIGEAGVEKAESLLGVTETEPIDFYVYPDSASFRDVLGPGTRENVGGVAYVNVRTLVTQIGPDQVNASWVANVVPHELTHLVFDTATRNEYHSPPHWLNEGLAVYLAVGYGSGDRSDIADAIRSDSLMPLPALDGQFPTAGDRFSLGYAESVSAVDFMVREYGRPALVKLIRSYAEGRTDDEAFSGALGVDVAGFNAAWLHDLGVASPKAFGPQPAPAGPLPPGWDAPAPTPGTIPGETSGASPGATPAPGSSPAPSGSEGTSSLLVSAVVTIAIVLVVIGLMAFAMRRRRQPTGPP